VRELRVKVTDDDGGVSEIDCLAKLITGDSECAKSQGFWKHQVSGKGKPQVDEATVLAFLEIVTFGSGIFDLATLESANNVFSPPKQGNNGNGNGGSGSGSASGSQEGSLTGTGSKGKGKGKKDKGDGSGSGSGSGTKSTGGSKLGKFRDKALGQTLAAWLNFASGAIDWDEMIDTTGDGAGDTSFGALIAEVESILNNPDATKADLERAKDLAEAVNLHDKDNPDCDTGTGTGTGSKTGTGSGTKSGTGSGSGTGGSKPGKK